MPKVIIDHRERSSGIIKELAKKGLDIEVKNLVTADFIISSTNHENNEILVGIEKKTQNDFLNSIIDKRIISQLILLKENFQIPLLIIEGSDNIYTLRNFHPNSIRGMLASIAIDFQIPMLHTKNFRDTASLISIIAKRLENPRRNINLLKKRKPLSIKEQQELIIETLPGIGSTLSKSLLKKFKTVKKIINAKHKQLEKVEKIGKIKASQIRKVLDEKYF